MSGFVNEPPPPVGAWTPLSNVCVGGGGGQGDQKASGDHNALSSVCPESPGSPQFSHLRHGRGERGHHGLAEPVDAEAAPPARHGPRNPAALARAVAGGGGAGRARRAEALSRVTAPGGGGKMRLRLLALAATVLLSPAPGKRGMAGGSAGGRGSSGRRSQGCTGSWWRSPPGRSRRRKSSDPGFRGSQFLSASRGGDPLAGQLRVPSNPQAAEHREKPAGSEP